MLYLIAHVVPQHRFSKPLSSWRPLGLVAVTLVALLAACAGVEKDPTAKWDADRLYNEARTQLQAGAWSKARELYEKLEARYPFGRYAQQAEIEIAYCYYKEGETADAISATDRFLKLNPTSPNADYIYYLRGLINFIEPPVLLGRLIGYRVSERDPKALRESFEAFKELLSRFPSSRYRDDALLRLSFLRDALADHEVRVADYYYRRGAYLAAINRAQGALREYQGAPSLEHALGIMLHSYERLGMLDLRAGTERVLRANYPNSPELRAGL
ncbi:MAG TPA: outer membrane protein assembly factor BamD [Burkholderiaceae bacterium]|nr:outer membrane protein assembly factor BamD [Burkholderiaceae bacterium]